METHPGSSAGGRVLAAAAAAVRSGMRTPFSMVDEDSQGRYALGGSVAADMHVDTMRPGTAAARAGTAHPAPPTATRVGTAGTMGRRAPLTAGASRVPTAAGRSAPYPIIAVTENRAREVGIAYVNLAAMHTIELLQIADNQSFTQTLALLHVLAPVEIIISRSQIDRLLFQKIIHYWGGDANPLRTQISAINRKFFDEVRGEAVASSLSCRPVQPDVLFKYLALASLAALTKYVENMQRIHFAERAMVITTRESTGRMSIDFDTLKSLEVLRNVQTHAVKDSLLGVMDYTSTAVGLRLLRAQMVNPINDASTLYTRLDCVDEILRSERAYFAAQGVLKQLPDLDGLLSQYAYTPRLATPRTARASIHAVILLKHTLEQMPRLHAALSDLTNPLLVAIRGHLEAPALRDVHAAIVEIVHDETSVAAAALAMRQQECFAVRAGVDGTLDAVRKVYTDCIDNIQQLVDAYKKTWDMAALRLTFTVSRGYHLLLPASNVEALPAELAIQVVRNKSTVACSTDELASLNDRAQESLFNVYVITNTVVQELLGFIRQHMHPLFKMTESIAMLDMLLSFAGVVVSSPKPESFCRPTFTEDGATVIVQGRHPIAERLTPTPFVPNDVYLSPDASLLLLTGPNCSGKSTFLKQVALLVLLAHIGCYLPAASASIRLTDRICTRMGTSDDMESNASTFLKEMKEAAFILQQLNPESGERLPFRATPGLPPAGAAAKTWRDATTLTKGGDRVLVLLDELGRGTANEDGVGLAWSICEYLLTTRAHSVVATHYHELGELTAMYPHARAYNMAVEAAQDASSLHFKYSVGEGASAHQSDYGIQLAQMAGLPPSLVEDARRIKVALVDKLAPRPMTAASAWTQTRMRTAGSLHTVRTTPAREEGGNDTSSVTFRPDVAQIVLSVAQKRMVADVVARLTPLTTASAAPDAATHSRMAQLVSSVYADYVLQLTALGIPRLCGMESTDMSTLVPSPRTISTDTQSAPATRERQSSEPSSTARATLRSDERSLSPMAACTPGYDCAMPRGNGIAPRTLHALLSAAEAPNSMQAQQAPMDGASSLSAGLRLEEPTEAARIEEPAEAARIEEPADAASCVAEPTVRADTSVLVAPVPKDTWLAALDGLF